MRAEELVKAMDDVSHLIVLSPHLDDGVLSCGALMSHVREHIPVTVVTFFTEGCAPPYTRSARRYLRQTKNFPADSLFRARRAEDEKVLGSAGISYTHVGLAEALFRRRTQPLLNRFPWVGKLIPELAYIYPTYRLHVIRGGVSRDDADTARRIIDAMDDLSTGPTTLFLAPLAVGGHKDHMIVRTAAQASGRQVVYYSDFPYNTLFRTDPSFAHENLLASATWSQGLTTKQSLIRGYRTQVDALFPDGKIPVVPEVYLLPQAMYSRLAAMVSEDR